MFKKILSLIFLVAIVFSFSSCSRFTVEKHMEKAEKFEKQDRLSYANDEYRRALRGIVDPLKKAQVSEKVAENFNKLREYDNSIKYYKESMDAYKQYNANLPEGQKTQKPPYVKLAAVYIANEDPSSALALLKNIELDSSAAGMQDLKLYEDKLEINRLVADYYQKTGDLKTAIYYWNDYQSLAEENELADRQKFAKSNIKKLTQLTKNKNYKTEKEKKEKVINTKPAKVIRAY
ncbi:MAG: hypothetical protein ACLFQV_05785 [Vulcanimicrobiota bacterium]